MNNLAVLTTSALSELREDVLNVSQCRTFELPDANIHVVGISGGVDSSAVALVMAALFGHLPNLVYIFTDTGVEASGTIEQIEKIEQLVGKPVLRLTAGLSLFDLIEKQGNFLPSQRQRWCTSTLKIKPLSRYFDSIKKEAGAECKIASYVGIRADEPNRTGGQYGDGGTVSYFPLQELGFDRTDVYKLVSKWIGIPRYYEIRSRSGCVLCIFSRRSEVLGAIQNEPKMLQRASAMEELNAADKAKLLDLPTSVMEQAGVSRNHLMFALPVSLLGGRGPQSESTMPWETFRAKVDTSANIDMFDPKDKGTKTFFVAVQMRVGWLGGQSGHECYMQEYITHSTSLGGLKTSLKHYWLHRINTTELFDLKDEDDLRNSFKIAIFEIQLDDADSHLAISTENLYTWQNDGQPILALRKTRYLLEQILLTEGLEQGLKDSRKFVREESVRFLPKITDKYGRILWSTAYDAPTAEDLEDDFDIEDAPVACNTCSR